MSEIIRREACGEVAILHITSSSVDAVSAAAIASACQQLEAVTVLDFGEVAFINSAGISALLKFVVQARKSGQKLFAMNLTPHHQKVFKMVEMSRFMPTIELQDLAAYR